MGWFLLRTWHSDETKIDLVAPISQRHVLIPAEALTLWWVRNWCAGAAFTETSADSCWGCDTLMNQELIWWRRSHRDMCWFLLRMCHPDESGIDLVVPLSQRHVLLPAEDVSPWRVMNRAGRAALTEICADSCWGCDTMMCQELIWGRCFHR